MDLSPVTLIDRFAGLRNRLPLWMQDWLEVAVPVLQILLIIFVAWLLHRLFKRVIKRASQHYEFPHELLMPVHAVVR
ncbi:MAG: mechanosensitive ion channel family protein, partial [Comamonadaceae bacterium]|nr:mechanosensitive ion channel family protein [Comamonadaceae bacterium]